MRLLLLLLVANGCGFGQSGKVNPNIDGRCKCTECLLLDNEEYTLSNDATDMNDKCVDNGCLMTHVEDQSETCVCHEAVSVTNTKDTDYDDCQIKIIKHIPESVWLSSVYHDNAEYKAENCINNNTALEGPICHTKQDLEPYLKLKMKKEVTITKVILYDDNCSQKPGCVSRLENVEVWVGGDKLGHFKGPGEAGQIITIPEVTIPEGKDPLKSMWVDIRMTGPGKSVEGYLHLQEVEVYGLDD